MIKLIELDALRTEGLQTRDGLSPAVVQDYAELMKGGVKLPPLSVTRTPKGELYLTDGFHRLAAMRRLKRTMADAEIAGGEFTDAVRAALKANAAHGLRRSNADKRNALRMAWEHRVELFGGEPSHEVLAEACAVSKRTAQRFRDKVAGVDNVHPCERVGKDGKTYRETPSGVDNVHPCGGVDRFGTPIPSRLAGAFGSSRYGEVVKAARQVKAAIAAAMDEGDCAFSKVSQSALITLDNFIADMRGDAPYCVCPQCGGRGCRACGDVGVQTKREYDLNPVEMRTHA